MIASISELIREGDQQVFSLTIQNLKLDRRKKLTDPSKNAPVPRRESNFGIETPGQNVENKTRKPGEIEISNCDKSMRGDKGESTQDGMGRKVTEDSKMEIFQSEMVPRSFPQFRPHRNFFFVQIYFRIDLSKKGPFTAHSYAKSANVCAYPSSLRTRVLTTRITPAVNEDGTEIPHPYLFAICQRNKSGIIFSAFG